MERWIFTGISGSGRIELLNELKKILEAKSKKVIVSDIGDLIRKECQKVDIKFSDKRILDLDTNVLKLLRSSALKEAILDEDKNHQAELHLIGTHATFRWKHRLIPGLSIKDLKEIKITGFVNVIDNVKDVFEINKKNPKWNKDDLPDSEQTQEWMTEEEFITEVLAEVFNIPIFIVAKKHRIENLADLFISKKKKIYLSYPITAVRKSNPELIEKIQGEVLDKLENLFVVFNPLVIEDMNLTYDEEREKSFPDLPELVEKITPEAKELIKSRTVARDFQFIDQADAIVVFYLTDKISPGVLAEIFYAHRNQKPVYVVYKGSKSPFIEHATTIIVDEINDLFPHLEKFSKS